MPEGSLSALYEVPMGEESPRLSTASSVSSNERMSTVTVSECSASVSADFSETDRPVSVVSTISSGSSRDGQSLYGSMAALTATTSTTCQSEPQHQDETDIDLELSPSEADMGTEVSDKVEVSLRASRSRNNNNNNTANRASMDGSRQPPLSPFAAKAMAPNPKLSYVDRVVMEIIETERMYVRDLRSIVEDYLAHIIDTPELSIRPEQVCALFGNIEDIYGFNSELLQALDMCENDPVAIAQCFVEKSDYFDIYTQYCTNYPNSVAALTDCMRDKFLAKFFRERQASLKRSLPLGSYLLKPVQRILKYHLLLQEIAKHFDPQELGYEVVEEAIDTMTGVAWYINDMKRKHEHAVRLQEVQSLLLNWKGPDLTTYGELVLEGTFRLQRAKNERTLFLFDKMLLITKKRGEHYVYKTFITCSTLMLIESTRDSLTFSVTHYKHPKQPHTVQARTVEEKRLWAHHIKRLILENHHAIIPQKAKEAILEMDSIYPYKYKYSPERLKKSLSSHAADDFTDGGRQGRRLSEPAKQIMKNTKAILKHADSEGALLADSGSLQAGASVGTLASRLGDSEAERPSMEEDEEEADYEELGLSKESLERLNPSDSEVPSQGAELPAFRAEEGEDEEDEILMGDDQNGEGHDLIEENGFQRQNSQSSGKEVQKRSVEGGYLIEQAAEEVEQIFNEEIHSESEDRRSEEHSSDSEPVIIDGRPPDAPEATQHPEPEDDQTEERQETALESVSADTAEEPKTLSSGESSEDEEEEEPTTECEPQGILPTSVLDQASVIAERFLNNLSRRDSLIMEDGRSLSCPSPRLTSRSSSILSLDAIEKAQKHSSTSSEAPGILTSREATALQANSTQESTSVLSPNSDNLFELERTPPYRRRDSTLSKQDRLLIDKIKSYYDHAEHQDVSFSIKRRESLTYIPPGLVRNSVCRFNNIPKDKFAPEEVVRNRIGGSACTVNSRPASWTVFDLPAMGKNSGPEPIAPKLEESSSPQRSETGSLSAENHFQNPVTDEEFKPSTEMIKVWQQMEKEVNSTHMEHSRKEIPEEVHPSGRPSPHLSRKGQVSNGSIAPKYNEPLMILEDDDLSTITEESSNSSPDKGSPRTMLFGGKPSWYGSEGNSESSGVRTSRVPTPRIIHLGSCFDNEMQDMEQVKSKVFQLARHFSQRTKTAKPVVKQRGMDGAGQLKKRNLSSVQEEKMEKESKGKPNLTLSFPVYDKVILQELSPSPQHKSPAQQCPSPVHTAGSSVSPRVLSPSRPCSKSPLSPVQSESFHWPDVQELRSKYGKKETRSGQSKLLSVARSCSVPEKMLEFPEGRSSNFNSTVNTQFGVRGRTASTSTAEHRTSKALQPDKAEGLSHPQICRTGSLDQRISGHHLDGFKNLKNEDNLKNMFYVSGETTLPSEQKVIVMEKVLEQNIDVDVVETGEDLEDDDSFVQIRSPTTREKISIRAVTERCKAYQESEEYRQREDGDKPDQGTMKGKAKEQDRPAFSNDQNVEYRRGSVPAAKKTDINQQSLVKNLREKFQNLSSNT
ncbi:pleckstrin homology domain-containing family G member 3-like isoform X2 [Polyodon spathula]|uniref:pleckstrin homology domain-containing family G member 3-like isoform X2 n=1 Tax=Polyodon spathula TaxID=7913 RepID=UPI001B7E37EC|nr:pleckstrin homology domain-containing family G member 3-like isoform X2 [Polyodon spathula]XP_041121071.1 pleckstrin homology domain-containing family G member 3-like isoform X2 [Polyodon spathula]